VCSSPFLGFFVNLQITMPFGRLACVFAFGPLVTTPSGSSLATVRVTAVALCAVELELV
jgi:hypothetical protein